ncbi:Rxlr effector protein, partial [Globisporangium splendens]
MTEEEIKTTGWTFKPHPLTTHCPWLVHERTPPNSIQKTIDQARTRRLHSKLHQGLGGLIDKLNEVAKTDQWYSHAQYRLPTDLWKQRGCLTPYQMWTTYRISTMQLNLFHPGRIESSACPSNAGCGETKETISHIVWSCKRAQAAWTAFLGRWMGRTLTEQALNLFLPHIASRTAPPGQRSLLRELEKHFGFITLEHSAALQKLWFIVTSSIPVLLWRTRVEIVHERQHLTIEECIQRVWTACVMQVRAVAHRMRTLKGEKVDATCLSQLLSVLERQDLSRQLEAWATARLYFDGGARGNPGPGGSGWALIFLNERSNRWELKACGYAYMGPEVTNNWCEYSALKDGLAYSAHYLQHYEVKLEVFGDSQMIIAAQNGFASIRQTKLQPLAVRVNQIIANFAWTSWNHTKREQNKMADLLANMAMISKSAKILTDESRGNDQVLMSQVAALLDNDIASIKSDKRQLSPEAPMMNMEQPKEGAARKEAPDGVSTKTAITLRSGRAQGDAEMAVRASQHGKGGAPDPVRTNDKDQLNTGGQDKSGAIEEGTTPTRVEGSRKEASTETAPVERYEALSAKLHVSPNAVNRVEIEFEVRLMFTALYNGMRILEKPKKANDNYPTLNGEEADALVDLFRLLAIEKGKSFPEWKRTIQDLCKDMHRSSWTVVALIQKRIDQNRLAAETKASPWGSQTSTSTQTNVKEQGTQTFIFKSNKYSEKEQRNMIRHCKQKFEYSVTLRQPTTMQWDIMLAIVEGELLIRCLLHFLRRVCDGDTLFRFQNTIAAQVKGELVGKLADAMQVYKDHQSTGRIVEAIFQAARFRNDGKMELRDEMGHNDDTLPTPIGAAHIRAPDGDNRRAIGVKQRVEQAIGSGRAADRRIEIHVQNQHLNIARSMNMALLLEYLKQTTGKRFYAYPLDDEIASQKSGPRQISKDGIRWAKELMRFRRDMDELMKVHVERQTELNPNRNDIMDWDGEYTIQDVVDANGLAEATTPPTGNCQFYAVAEAMLQIVHDNMANEKLLEATARGIKQGMNAAARLNFDLEFPEGTHLGILEALGTGDRKMSPKERIAREREGNSIELMVYIQFNNS